MVYSREEILSEIEQFRNDNPDDEEFYGVIADYIEQVQEESMGYRKFESKKDVILKEPVQAMALAIEVYRVLMEQEHKHAKLDPAQVAYELTKVLDHNYTFYYKRED